MDEEHPLSMRPPRETPSFGDEEIVTMDGFTYRQLLQDIRTYKTMLLKLKRIIQQVFVLVLSMPLSVGLMYGNYWLFPFVMFYRRRSELHGRYNSFSTTINIGTLSDVLVFLCFRMDWCSLAASLRVLCKKKSIDPLWGSHLPQIKTNWKISWRWCLWLGPSLPEFSLRHPGATWQRYAKMSVMPRGVYLDFVVTWPGWLENNTCCIICGICIHEFLGISFLMLLWGFSLMSYS